MSRERRLGRGLEALLGRVDEAAAGPDGAAAPHLRVAEAGAEGEAGLVQINVYELEGNPHQPRRDFDPAEIDQLAASIKEHGIIQPIAVRRVGGRYQLIAGERRLRAAIRAGWSAVPAQVLEVGDRQACELAIVENLQRKDLNAIEKAQSFQQYLDTYGCTKEELAARLHLDRSTVANFIRLLELPDEVQQALRTGAISQGHARALLPLGDERLQVAFCRQIVEDGWSVRAVEQRVQETIAADDLEQLEAAGRGARPGVAAKRPRSEHLASLEQELRAALGTKVEIRLGARGRGRIVVSFASHEEFDRLHAHICGTEGRRQAG